MFDQSSSRNVVPEWLETLLCEKFFNACIIHEDAKKNEKNIFCLDCCESICPHCLSPHRSHRLLQVRRYVYHDVIRLGDAEKLMDCSHVQGYTTNNAKVVFLNPRPQTRGIRNSNNICITCDRALQDPYLFCSISCKVNHIHKSGECLSKYMYDCEVLTLPEPGSDDGLMTPDSVLEPFGSLRTSSGSSGTSGGEVGCRTVGCTAATTEVVRKKRSTLSAIRAAAAACRPAVCTPVSEVPSRCRKGMPRRSPLH